MQLRWFACASALLWIPLFAFAETEGGAVWEPGPEDVGPGYRYQVFSQQLEGEDFIRYQVRGRVEASPQALRDAVRVIAADPAYAPDGQTRRLIATPPEAFVVYTLIDLPLLADRDIVSRGESHVDASTGTHHIRWRAVSDPRVPVTPDAVRIDQAGGFWAFAPQPDGSTAVTYETYIDLGGSIPLWIADTLMPGMVAQNFVDVATHERPEDPDLAPPPQP